MPVGGVDGREREVVGALLPEPGGVPVGELRVMGEKRRESRFEEEMAVLLVAVAERGLATSFWRELELEKGLMFRRNVQRFLVEEDLGVEGSGKDASWLRVSREVYFS